MNAQTETEINPCSEILALKESILHWQRIKNCIPEEKPIANQCACCILVNNNCDKCPIKKFTGQDSCNDTPYLETYEAFFNYHDHKTVTKREFQKICTQEIKFLKMILRLKIKESKVEENRRSKK